MRRAIIGFLLSAVVVLALAACGNGTTPAGNATEVQVTLTDFKVNSSLTSFAVNKPYHFVVTNRGATEHEFMITPAMMKGMDMGDAHSQALVMIDKIPAGETKSVDYTFTKQSAQGSLEMACHLSGHYDLGMAQAIEVTG
jgi:uncharacterized cupredoxin-like copper-binding protein